MKAKRFRTIATVEYFSFLLFLEVAWGMLYVLIALNTFKQTILAMSMSISFKVSRVNKNETQ